MSTVVEDGRQVVEILLESIAPHPHNRTIAPETIAARAESMQAEGQLEPIEVRALTDSTETHHYEIISGETRWRAAGVLGWKTIEARIRLDVSEQEALRLLAAYNEQRTDLDDIQRAELIERLCAKPAGGGGGMKRKEAAAVFGLTSSAASNLVKLLELDDAWRDRLRQGKLPQRLARIVARFAVVPGLLDELGVDFDRGCELDGGVPYEWSREEDVLATCQQIAADYLQPIEGWEVQQSRYGIAGYGNIGCLFDWEPQAEALEVIELPANLLPPYRLQRNTSGESPERIRAALNQELYRELQDEAVESGSPAAVMSGVAEAPEGQASPKKKGANKPSTRKPLGERIDLWRDQWLRQLLGEAVAVNDWRSWKLFCYLVAKSQINGCMFEAIAQSIFSTGISRPKFYEEYWQDYANAVSADTPEVTLGKMVSHANRLALLGESAVSIPPAEIPRETLEDMARDYELDLAEQWQAEQDQQLTDHQVALLKLHTIAELRELAAEWGVHFHNRPSKASMVKQLQSRSARKRLPLPKAVTLLERPAKAKSQRKRTARKKAK